ncbi:hypothetical protein DYB32_009473 [Aphanomyces invadans]|uniref:Uncharacterized protein n=1 Tax=Aphanomyces invadans TaxID=157072 RepID=A0A418AI51_9STRA|nr:hypothetical protein DYB32_009473 [Aphanomyces invadans]
MFCTNASSRQNKPCLSIEAFSKTTGFQFRGSRCTLASVDEDILLLRQVSADMPFLARRGFMMDKPLRRLLGARGLDAPTSTPRRPTTALTHSLKLIARATKNHLVPPAFRRKLSRKLCWMNCCRPLTMPRKKRYSALRVRKICKSTTRTSAVSFERKPCSRWEKGRSTLMTTLFLAEVVAR